MAVNGYVSGLWLTYPSETYDSWDDDIPNIWKHIKCSKPPTRLVLVYIHIEFPKIMAITYFRQVMEISHEAMAHEIDDTHEIPSKSFTSQ